MNEPKFSERHWIDLISVLSLDWVKELHLLIGVDSFLDALFLTQLRECIVSTREELARSSVSITASTHLLRCLKKHVGDGKYARFLQWARTAYIGDTEEQAQEDSWRVVLSQWYNPANRPKDITPDEMRTIVDHLRALDDKETQFEETQLPAMKARKLSEWDVEVYNRFAWNHFALVGDPYTILSLVIHSRNALQVLQKAQNELPPETLERLRIAGQTLLEKLGIAEYKPEPLVNIKTVLDRL